MISPRRLLGCLFPFLLAAVVLNLAGRAAPGQSDPALEQLVERDPEKAIQRLEEIVQEAPTSETFYLLARAWARIDANESLRYLERVFGQSPRHLQAWRLWADIMNLSRQYDYAAFRLERQLEADPDFHSLRLILAQLYVNRNRLAKAKEEFGRLVEGAAEGSEVQVQALYSLGYLHVVSGEIQPGRGFLERALQQDPSYLPAMIALADLLLGTGEREEADRWLSLAEQRQPANPGILLLRGRSHLQKGQWSRAAQVLRALLQQDPDHVKAHFFLAKAYKAQGDARLAEEHIERFRVLQKKALEERVRGQEGLLVRGTP